MLKFIRTLSTNQRLAVLALALGIVAIPATPAGSGRATISAREMTWLMSRGADRVDPRTLADWIIQGRSDYRLIDLRDPAAYAAGPRIPTSENIPVATLEDAGLAPDERILLVAGDEARAAQAWFLLTAQGYAGVAIVSGGIRGWMNDVLYPNVDGMTAAERARAVAVSARFGGAPRTGGGAEIPLPSPSLSQSAVPPPPPAATGAKPAKKKREGC